MVGGDADDKDEHESDDEQDDVDHDDCIVGGGADWLEVMLQAASLIGCPASVIATNPPTHPLSPPNLSTSQIQTQTQIQMQIQLQQRNTNYTDTNW